MQEEYKKQKQPDILKFKKPSNEQYWLKKDTRSKGNERPEFRIDNNPQYSLDYRS